MSDDGKLNEKQDTTASQNGPQQVVGPSQEFEQEMLAEEQRDEPEQTGVVADATGITNYENPYPTPTSASVLAKSNSKAMKIIIAVTALLSLGATLYAFSPYYIPSNYLPAVGYVQRHELENKDFNYYISFTTRAGQHVLYKYQTIIPDHSLGAVVSLHYNENNPQQVKVRPSTEVLLAELAIADLLIPIGGMIIILKGKRMAKEISA